MVNGQHFEFNLSDFLFSMLTTKNLDFENGLGQNLDCLTRKFYNFDHGHGQKWPWPLAPGIFPTVMVKWIFLHWKIWILGTVMHTMIDFDHDNHVTLAKVLAKNFLTI